jgi:DNA topoisomerase-1
MKDKVLIVVESPAKTKNIRKYLSKAYPSKHFVVEACHGHIRDLPKKEIGINIDSMQIDYIPDKKKLNIIGKLKKHLTRCNEIILASDNDREGEAIAWHIKELLKLKDGEYHRMIFNEITPDALINAYQNLTTIDMNLVNAQQTRRIIDRLFGYKLTQLIWKHIKMENNAISLSAGRVQSACMNMIICKEEVVNNAIFDSSWIVQANFIIGEYTLPNTRIVMSDTLTVKRFSNIADTTSFLQSLKDPFKIKTCHLYNSNENAPPPLITTSLQQEAYNTLSMSVKTTMTLAQQLYERGYITYMRTDNFELSENALQEIGKFVIEMHGTAMHKKNNYAQLKNKIRNSQQAHEAIRPTNIFKDGNDIKEVNLKRLYDLIRKRTIASQMIPCTNINLDMYIVDQSLEKSNKELFQCKLHCILIPGWRIIYGDTCDFSQIDVINTLAKQNDTSVKLASDIQAINSWIASETTLYNEPGVIKSLEKAGVGRPSTYASILEKLYTKSYVVKKDVLGRLNKYTNLSFHPGNQTLKHDEFEKSTDLQKSRLVPTPTGRCINDFLKANFQGLIDIGFTTQMEDKLDKIANGELLWHKVLQEFNYFLDDHLRNVVEDQKIVDIGKQVVTFNNIPYIIRLGKYGPVIELQVKESSSAKPRLKVTKSFIDLKPYMKIYNKSYTDITDVDISRLVGLPRQIDGETSLCYGRYGFYIKHNEKSYTISTQFIRSVLKGETNSISPVHIPIILSQKTTNLKKKHVDKSKKRIEN